MVAATIYKHKPRDLSYGIIAKNSDDKTYPCIPCDGTGEGSKRVVNPVTKEIYYVCYACNGSGVQPGW